MKKVKLNIQKMIRPSCAGFQPYVAGKPIETIKRELGLSRVVKLASNENPLGPSKAARAALCKAAGRMYFYPDSNSWNLRQALSKKYGLPPAQIVLGAGSDEIIELIAKAFFKPTDNIVVSEHAFIRYAMAGELMGCNILSVPMKGFTHDLDAMARVVNERTKAVFIANPNNPTGTYNTKTELEAFLKKVSFRNNPPLVVMDEAYYEYARAEKGYPETVSSMSRYPNLVVLRTFSKIYGLAGARVGYGFGAPEVIDYLDRIRPPFNVSLPAQEAAVASLGDATQVTKSVRLVEKEKAYLYKELQRRAIAFVPSAGNFVLVEVSPRSGKEVFQLLLHKGVIVRAMDEYKLPNHIRVSIGLPAENKLFIRSLESVLS